MSVIGSDTDTFRTPYWHNFRRLDNVCEFDPVTAERIS